MELPSAFVDRDTEGQGTCPQSQVLSGQHGSIAHALNLNTVCNEYRFIFPGGVSVEA